MPPLHNLVQIFNPEHVEGLTERLLKGQKPKGGVYHFFTI